MHVKHSCACKKCRSDGKCFLSSPIPSTFSSSYLPSYSESVLSVTFLYSWWISVCSTNRLPGRTARVLKRSETDRTLSELEKISYHVYRGCRQEAVKPIGLHSQRKKKKKKKTVGLTKSRAHNLWLVMWHRSTCGLVQKRTFPVTVSGRIVLNKTTLFVPKSSMKLNFNESDTAFVSSDWNASLLLPFNFLSPLQGVHRMAPYGRQ